MRANFPNCPPWFDEGLASLYEASTERDGHIQGLVNWRYKGLAKAIREGTTISFEKLTMLTPDQFYDRADGQGYGEYYGQARYLCYYLQEKRLLVSFYRQFVTNATTDPTGYQTLMRVLKTRDMDGFKKKWEAFLLGLSGQPTPKR